jgi:ABC-type tungstate transport system substrate-binding protein
LGVAEEVVYKIQSEEDALNLLKDAIDKKIAPGEHPTFEWVGWPFVKIELPDTPIQGSISPAMMLGFIEFQKSIYRSHTLLLSGTESLRSLNRYEREELEFRVKVDKGSSLYSINLQEIAQKLGADVIAKMNGTELVITVLGISLIVGGVIAWKAWLDNRTDQRRIDSDDADTRVMLDSFKGQLDHDTKRYEMLTRAITQQPILKKIEQVTEPARQEIISAVAEEHGGIVNGIELSPIIAKEVSVSQRQQSTDIELSRIYRVDKVDTTVPDGFRVTLTDVNNGQEVSASLLDALVSGQHREALQQAEWQKKPVQISLRGRRLRGEIVGAQITSVEEPKLSKGKKK